MGQGTSRTRGVALLTAIFFGILCLGMAMVFLIQVPVDLGATAMLEKNTKASYIAEAAVTDTMAWISYELANAREPCTSSDPSPSRSGTLDGWDWTCRVVPDSGTPPNALTDLRLYKLTAVASLDGKEAYRVETDVQAGQSFARFSVFIDRDGAITYDFLVTPQSQVQGPIHKNHPIRLLVDQSFQGDLPTPTVFPFQSVVSTTAATNVWTVGGTGTFADLSDQALENIFQNGRQDLQYSVTPRPLPGDSSVLATAAWGGGPPPPAPPVGLSVNPMGGVYVQGEVTSMRLGVDPGGNFVLTVTQGGTVSTVVEDRANDRRLVTVGGSTTQVPGAGTGVIFVDGNILSLEGENKGPHTIANRFDAHQTMEISGSITRRDTPPLSQPTGIDDRLGLVSGTILIADESVRPRSVANPLLIYATVLATDVFRVKDRLTGNPGAMAIYGGMASGDAWETVGFDNLTNLRTTSGYGGLSGYGSANIYYDKLLADQPPPEYPTTAPADLKIRSWREFPL